MIDVSSYRHGYRSLVERLATTDDPINTARRKNVFPHRGPQSGLGWGKRNYCNTGFNYFLDMYSIIPLYSFLKASKSTLAPLSTVLQ